VTVGHGAVGRLVGAAPVAVEAAVVAARLRRALSAGGVRSAAVEAGSLATAAPHALRRRSLALEPADLRRVVAVVARLPGLRMQCLGRSLTLWTLLRRRGMTAELRIGAAPRTGAALPAHAWVELAGEPVGERVDGLTAFGDASTLHVPAVTG
jgi:hypothetical protein